MKNFKLIGLLCLFAFPFSSVASPVPCISGNFKVTFSDAYKDHHGLRDYCLSPNATLEISHFPKTRFNPNYGFCNLFFKDLTLEYYTNPKYSIKSPIKTEVSQAEASWATYTGVSKKDPLWKKQVIIIESDYPKTPVLKYINQSTHPVQINVYRTSFPNCPFN